jgi:transaldolase
MAFVSFSSKIKEKTYQMVKFKRISIYADGADIGSIKNSLNNKLISGFTTNPTLMRKSGIKDYEKFSKKVAKLVYPKSISLEVFSDDLNQMYNQAKIISSWNKNIFVKIPIVNTKGVSTNKIIEKLSDERVNLNITAIFTIKQIRSVMRVLNKKSSTILSIFAGRIADSGRDPKIIIKNSVKICKKYKNIKILWASTREAYNIIEAANSGCHIITASDDIINKIKNFNKDLNIFSKETVQMFYKDAKSSGYKIKTK